MKVNAKNFEFNLGKSLNWKEMSRIPLDSGVEIEDNGARTSMGKLKFVRLASESPKLRLAFSLFAQQLCFDVVVCSGGVPDETSRLGVWGCLQSE
jgi:hypothetical protein